MGKESSRPTPVCPSGQVDAGDLVDNNHHSIPISDHNDFGDGRGGRQRSPRVTLIAYGIGMTDFQAKWSMEQTWPKQLMIFP
jgi:hypothetical protein